MSRTAHPEVDALLAELAASGRPSSMSLPLQEGRRNFVELCRSLAAVEDRGRTESLRLPEPAADLEARVYFPADHAGGPLPITLFLHGGGWVFGGLDSHDPFCRALACDSRSLVVGLDYRLAPEAPFPAALDDGFTALRWLAEFGDRIGGDPELLSVAGDSSGANLAAGLALRARDEGDPPLWFQCLLYPATDPSMSTPSYQENAEDPFLSRSEMEWYWRQYTVGDSDRANPYAAPARARDLRGLPPALVVTCGLDPLRDEGEAYAGRLSEAGVPVRTLRYDDMPHGFLLFTAKLTAARTGTAEIAQQVRAGLQS